MPAEVCDFALNRAGAVDVPIKARLPRALAEASAEVIPVHVFDVGEPIAGAAPITGVTSDGDQRAVAAFIDPDC